MAHKQTKQSFAKYIEECRQDASKMEAPPDRLGCPVCGGITFLKKEEATHTVEGATWKGTKLYYECGKCKEKFTSTESNTATVASFKLVEPPNNNP